MTDINVATPLSRERKEVTPSLHARMWARVAVAARRVPGEVEWVRAVRRWMVWLWDSLFSVFFVDRAALVMGGGRKNLEAAEWETVRLRIHSVVA